MTSSDGPERSPDVDLTCEAIPAAGSRMRIGSFEILEPLGAGGMGQIYKARDTRLERIVALKLLPDALRADPVARRRLLREARVAAQLDHSAICPVFAVEEQGGSLCIVMQYLEGRSLFEALKEGPLDLPAFFNLAMQVTSGLSAAHDRGLVHRDIKPGNIMLTTGGKAKVVDFGIARVVNANEVSSMTPSGTLAYLAPEVLLGRAADARTDLFSLGATFYEALSGRRPFGGETPAAVMHNILESQPAPLGELRPDVPEAVASMVGRLLEKDPDRRYASARQLLNELERISGLPGTVAAPPLRPRRRVAWLWAFVGLLAILGLGMATRPWRIFQRQERAPHDAASRPQAVPQAPPLPAAAPAGVAPVAAEKAPASVPTARDRGLTSIAALPFLYAQKDRQWTQLETGIADALAEALVRSGRFRVVERAQLDRAMEELRLNQGAAVDPATAQHVGKLVGARFLVLGSFQVLQDQIRINARLIRVETGEIVHAQTVTGKADAAIGLLDSVGREFLARLGER